MNLNHSLLLTLAAAAVVPCMAFADGDDEHGKNGFSLTLSGTYNDGNTDSSSANLLAEQVGDLSDIGAYKVGAEGAYGRSENDDGKDETTVKNGKLSGKLTFPVKGEFYSYLDGSAFFDDIADVDYRYMIGPGVGYNLIKTDSLTFSVEAGVSPMWEKIAGESEYYTMARLAERVEYVFSTGAKIWEQVEYLPALDDGDKYLVNAEAGVESPVSEKLSLQIVVKDAYNSLPGEGNEYNDVKVLCGIRVKL